jgi:beta-phosphoglucomutase
MIQAIFFDFNGVIIDDEALQMRAYQEVFAPYGITLSEAEYYSALGMDDRAFVQTTFERAGKKLINETRLAISEAKLGIHRRLLGATLPLFPGVVTFLKAASRSFSLGLVSMASREEIRYVFDRARLECLFSVVVSAEDVNVCKPAPDCYLKAIEKLNAKRRHERLLPLLPAECLVVEDSPPGIQSGRSAGMRTLGVTNTVSEAELRAAAAEVVTPNLSDWNVHAVRHVFS